MNSRIRAAEVIIRMFLVCVFLITTLIPSSSAAAHIAREWRANHPDVSPKKDLQPLTSLPKREAIYYNPAFTDPPPMRFSPEPDEPPPDLPAKEEPLPVEFWLEASPRGVGFTGIVTIQATIRNNTDAELLDLKFVDELEDGLGFVSSDDKLVSFDKGTRTVTASIKSVGVGEEFIFSYKLQATASGQDRQAKGRMWLHGAELFFQDQNKILTTRTPLIVGRYTVASDQDIDIVNLDGGWSQVGETSIYFDRGFFANEAIVTSSPVRVAGSGPDLQFKLELYEIEGVSRDSRKVPDEQKREIRKAITGNFAEPAYIEVNFDQVADLDSIPAGKEAFVATYDEAHQVWVKVPILSLDYQDNTVLVAAAKFSIWGAGLGDSMPQNGANVLLFDQPYTSLFTGSARYSIPIWTPPGRGDMAPSIALSYSSATVDGVLGDVQAPWVGVGWNIDSIEIVRKITTDENGYGYENDFALTLNGALHELIQDETDPTRFHTERGSFLYIERHNVALGNDEGENNTTGEWWEVVATDGTRYQLGRNSDSEQLALMYGYECIIGSPCNTPEGPYASLGYAGIAEDLVALRWRVDRITDTHDNYIDYTYMEDHPDPNSQIPAFDRASYMSSIKYTGHLDSQGVTDVNPGYEVKFILADRSGVGDGQPTDFNIWDNYDEKYLDKIEIYCTGCGIVDDPVIRTYDFSYSAPSAPNSQGTLVLDDISITGGDYPENEISIPNTTSATVKFTYENKDNREVTGEDDPWTYPRLTVIDNGYEGTLTYTYENDGRGTNSWYNWRVSKVMVDSGVGSPGTAAVMEYTYDTPKYTGIGSNPDLGELIGYTYNTETSYEFDETTEILDIKHHFGTEGLDIGREIWTEWIDPSTSDVLRKMENTYVTDNSQAPFEGWNYRYLAQVENYERIGSSLSMINKTTYQRDGGTGNLVLQVTYLGSTPYRKQYYEYVTNSDPEVHILDRVSRQVLADANNVVYADTRYQYDSGGTLTQGELSLMQTLTGSGSQTVDTGYTYDDYGNVISTKAYESYGTLGTSPNGEYQNTSSIYDTTFYTYPLTVANDLGYEVNTTYFRSMGLPFTVADPNNVITQTKYDGLGRVLSVTIPNEDEVGSVGFQYEYPTPAGGIVPAPYNIEMQIRDTIAIGDPFRSVWGIYDGLGRIIQNQVDDADNGKLLVTDTSFNAQGVVDKQSVPQSLSGTGGTYISPSWEAIDKTATAYDLLGRTTQIIAPGNIISQMAYSGLTTTVTDANGNNVKRETDGLGRLKTVKEYINSSDLYSTTSYYYDIKDQLEDVVDSQFNVTALTYNWLGQKIQMIDPDMGSWYYAYDSLGNLERQTDAELQRICFYYDSLNRLTGKYYHNSDSCPDEPTMDITYTYDTGAGQKGFRTGMGDESGTTTWTYSNAGRTVQETRNITGTSQKIFTTTTDWLGRVESIVNPDETITYTYDALGRPENFSSSDISGVTLADLAYNTFGQITSVALGNGALISNDYDTENSTFRLKNRSVDVGPTNLLDFEYFYDLVGNITQINDNKLGEIITYQYDDLNRLTSAEAISDTDYAYRQQFEYDKVGNILEVSEWSEDVIFKDDFESGDLSAWSSSVTDGGDLSATNSGPRVGDYSLQATLDDTNSIYVTDTSPDSETRYRARLYLDPVMLTMTAGDAFQLFGAYTNTPTQIVKVELAKSGSSYQVRASVLNDSSSFTDSSWVTISNDWTSVEIDWSAASGAGQDDGYLTLWIDGEQEANLTSVDNDTHTVTEARLGALADLDSGTSGALYLDAFESRSITYIGMLPDIDPPPPPTPPPPLLNGLISYWKLDETSGTRIDSVGSRDLTDNNTVGYTTGKQSNAADFERGNTEYLSYDTPYGTATDGDVSISVWINMESLGGDYYGSGIIASYRNPNVAGDWNIAVTNDGRIRFYRKESGTDYYWQTGTSEISTSTWYHLVVTYDDAGNSASCYINNASKSFSVVNAEVSWGTTALTVGRNFTTQNFYHDGLLDELAVYDRVLTTPEVAQLYNSGDGLTYPFSDGGAALPRNNSGSNEVASAGDDVLTSNPVAGNLGNTYSDILYRPIPPIAPPSQPIQRPLQLASLNTGLVAYWDLDEESSTRFDSIGSNHLADNNTVEYGAGKISNGADFVSANDEYLSIADNSNLSTGDVDFTVGLWVKLDDKTSNRAFVWKGNGDQTNLEYALMYNAVADRFRFLITDNGIANYHHVDANTLGSPAIDTWYHIIAWHDAANDTLNIQVDNETADSIFYASGLTDTTYAFALGGDQDQASFDGLMDEVGFWKKVLNADERASLYNYGSGNTYPFSDPTPTPTLTPTITPTFTLTPTPTVSVSDLTTKLLAYWKLDEASGNRADSYGSNMLIDNNSVGQGSGIVKENSADFESSSNHWFSLNTPISFADQEESTLFFWIDREDDINSYLTGSQSTTHTMNLQLDGDVKFYNDSGTPAPKWTSVLNEEPHSLCFTLESNRDITLYIDGVSQGTHTFSTHSAYTIDVIGNSGAGDGDFDGLLDEFAIFNDTLTQDEIDYLHNNGFGRTLPFTDPAYDQTPSPTPTDTPTATSPPMVNAHWNFNEGTGTTAADDSGNNNTLTLYNDTTWADGVGSTGKALYLDGVGDYAMGNDSASLKPTNGFSLSAWIYPEGFGDADRYIFNKVNDYGLKVDEDGFLHFFIPDLTPTDVTGPIPDLNEWTNVIGVYDKDNAQIKLYVNSVLVSSKDVTGYLNMGVGKPYIGTASGSWNGRVDEITLYGRPLSANEITSLYNDISTQPTMTPTATYTPTPETHTPTYTPTPSETPTPTATLTMNETRWGNGADGSLSVSLGNSYNIHTEGNAACADGGDAVAYSVTTLTTGFAILSTTPGADCLSAGDEIMIINLRGTQTYYLNTGRYEFLRVASVDTEDKKVTFTTGKVGFYGEGINDDYNIGTSVDQQRVMLMRVPNYTTVDIDGILTGNAFNGYRYGVISFRASDTITGFTGEGSIDMLGLGFDGGEGGDGPSTDAGLAGESYVGVAESAAVNAGGGGGGGVAYNRGHGGGGGGYGQAGGGGPTQAGEPYGSYTLSKMYLGSGGGGGGAEKYGEVKGGNGGEGGGSIFVAAYLVDFSGSISTEGADGYSNGAGGYGGGGSGGSVRVEGYTVSDASITAAGGEPPGVTGTRQDSGPGGAGRIAVFYENSLSSLDAIPYAHTEAIYSGAQPTPTATALVFDAPGPYGTGNDGDVTIAGGAVADMHTDNLANFRACADGGENVSYSVINLTSNYAQLSMSPSPGCLVPGDEVLLINLQGSSSYVPNVGNYEFLRIGAIYDNAILFTSAKTNYYGENAEDDTNMGVGVGQQRVVLMRVPNYEDLTVAGTLNGSTWNNYRFGVIAFRVSGSLTGSGTMDMNSLGFSGGPGGDASEETGAGPGEGINGLSGYPGTGGQGGGSANRRGYGGGGGGHGAPGEDGYGSYGGDSVGDMQLQTIFLGSGGGGGGMTILYGGDGSDGGNGGGILYLAADTIDFSGVISAEGDDTVGGGCEGLGGGGAGGSLRIEGDSIDLSSATISVDGGVVPNPSYPETDAGDGGTGRSAIYYETSYSGPGGFTPGYINNPTADDDIFSNDFESGGLGEWSASSSTDSGDLTVDAEADYWGDYGLKAFMDDQNSIYAQHDGSTMNDDLDEESHYRARFHFDPNSLTIGAAEILDIFVGLDDTTEAFKVQVEYDSNYKVRIAVYTDASTWTEGSWHDLTDGWNGVEIDWQASSTAGADDGHLTLWLDGAETETLYGVVNYTYAVDSLRLGAMGVDAGTSGSVYFDDFEARRYTYIGPMPDPGIPDPEPTAQPSWLGASYSYTGGAPHAVTSVVREQDSGPDITDTYTYDSNGNMTCRKENNDVWKHEYNEENRISAVSLMDGTDCTSQGSATDTWIYTYDGDGVRVKEVYSGTEASYTKYYFAGGAYEVEVVGETTTIKRYYSIAGMMVAMKKGTDDPIYFASDHLSSASLVMNDTGGLLSQNRYMPFGKVRDITGSDDPIDETDFGYTGQRNLADISLMDYNARFYSPTLGRFLQPDTIVPEPGNPQAWNRYSYVTNNPVIYNDPTGHFLNVLIGAGIGALVGGIGSAISQKITTGSVDMKEVAKAAGVGAVAGVVAGVTFGIGTAVLGSGLGASIASGAASGITSGIASRTMDNALHKRKLTQGVFYGKAILTDAAVGGIFGALGYGLRKVIARRLLQRATNRANTALHDDILVAQDVLSEAEYTAGQNHEGVARMNYGKAVERGTADVIDDSRILGDLFEHVGGPGKPDFIGKGLFKGLNFDVTTKAAIPAHQIRPYGPGLIFSTYSRPAGFTTFPWIH